MTDNLDLATAEKMLIEAGHPEQAAALKFYTEGIRNMMLGVVAPNFERALETILTKHIDALSRRLDNSDRARIKRNAEFQTELDTRLDVLGGKQDSMLSELKAVSDSTGKTQRDIAALKKEQARQGAIVDARPAQRLAEKQERLAWQEQIERRVEELERQRAINDNADVE